MNITLDHLTKTFGSGPAILRDFSLEIRAGELFFLLGPSGCGKTTVLRLLAGFIDPESGIITFAGKKMNGVPAQERGAALVFQNYALWPHMTVYENVAYGPRAKKLSQAEITERVRSALEITRMDGFAQRKAHQLSGGQQQRVALARALAAKPKLLLLDEPLSNLDAQLRLELRQELKRIHTETGLTTLFVTHDQEEALSLAQRIALMRAGQIEQLGSPQELYEKPVTSFVARFMGEMNLYPASSPLASALGLTTKLSWGFRPEQVELTTDGVAAKVSEVTYLGGNKEVVACTEQGEVIKLTTRQMLATGDTLHLQVPKPYLLTFPD